MTPTYKNLEEALNSKEFNTLYNNVSWNNLKLHEIPESERKLAYYLYLSGEEGAILGLEHILYKKKIPKINEYIDDHLGVLTPKVFPQWRKDLLEIFDDKSLVWEIILSGSIGCLAGDTKIPLLDGTSPTIKELSDSWKGEAIYLYSYDIKTDEVTVGHAFNPHLTKRDADVYEITLDNDEKIICTDNHPFLLSDNTYINAEFLNINDSLRSFRVNTDHKVKSIRYLGKQDVYDIQVLDHNNFAVESGVFVHNSGKTTIAILAQMFNLIRVSSLRNPQDVLGVMSNTLLFIMLISITMEKAGMALMMQFVNTLSYCDYFERVKKEEDFQDFGDTDKTPYLYTKNSTEILFPNNIRIIFGSRVSHTLSFALIGALLDEAEFRLCFSGDTKIISPDGHSYEIKDLVDKDYFYVYAYNHDTKRIDITKATGSKLSKRNSNLIKVTLDNNEVIECTPDHRFMMRDGSYREAKDLKVEDSLMPLYRKKSDESHRVKNYWMTLQPETNEWQFDHDLADNYNLKNNLDDNKYKKHIRHHVNFNKDNNSPENIKRMTYKDHYDLHRDLKIFKQVRIESNKRRWKTDREEMLKASSAGGKSTTALYNKDPKFIALRNEGLKKYYSSGKAKEQLLVKGVRLNTLLQQKRKDDPTFQQCISSKQSISRLKWLETLEGLEFKKQTSINTAKRNHIKYHINKNIVSNNCKLCITINHKVLSVEYVNYTKDVYDISVPGYQNFALSAGVFVHNSGLSDAVEVYANLKERVRSRFLDKKNLILLTLISSARYEKGIIADMLKSIQKDKSSKEYVRYLAYPIWEVRRFDSYDRGHFFVMRGTKSHPSRILTETEQVLQEEGTFACPPNCKVIKVPEEYRRDFLTNIELHLRNLAGEQTFGSEFLFDDLTHMEYDDLMPEITVELNLGTGQRIIDQLPKSFLINYNGKLRLSRYPNAPRYCFTGDTKVKLLSGISKTMVELSEDYKNNIDNWVYSWSNEHGWVPGKIISAHVSKSVTKLVLVILDNGEEIRCTLDHRFMMRDGSYKEAKDLKAEDSLMPIYSIDTDGYEKLLDNRDQSYIYTHKISDHLLRIRELHEEDYFLVRHHKDFNTSNNTPTNLEFIGNKSHIKLHSRHAEKCGFKNQWTKKEFRDLMSKVATITGKVNGKKNMIDNWHGKNNKEWRLRLKDTQKVSGTKNLIEYNKSDIHRETASKTMLITQKKYAHIGGKVMSAILNSRKVKCTWCDKESTPGAIGSHKRFCSFKPINHKVVSIKIIEVPVTAVYDITIEDKYDCHNFALDAGVIVSNCHLDLAETAEAGMGICHKEIKDGQFIVVVDLACRIITRTRIDMEEILIFIKYLKDVVEVKFNAATADRFQSAYILQKFKTEKIADEKDVKILSMDKETAPYRQFSDLVGSHLFHVGKCPVLKHQMEGVMEEVLDNGKSHITATDKKDLSDGVGGCVVSALMCTRDAPIYSRDTVSNSSLDRFIDPSRVMEL